jgi:hypothetical protein
MADLGQIVTSPEGAEKILTTDGWIPNTPELEEAASLGAAGTGLGSLMESLSMGVLSPDPAAEQFSPVAAKAGLAADVVGAAFGGAGLAKAGLRAGAKQGGRLVDRLPKPAPDQLIRRPSDMLNGTSGQLVKRLESAVESTPLINTIPLWQKATNQGRVNMGVAKGLGLSDETVAAARTGIDDKHLGEYVNQMRSEFNAVEEGITGAINPIDALPAMAQAMDSGLITGKLARRLEDATSVTGKEVMAVRSKLVEVLGSNEKYLVKEQAAEIIEQLDDIIEEAMDPEFMKAWQKTRGQYRLYSQLKRGRNMSPDGQVNVRSLDGSLSRAYGDDYRIGELDHLDPDVANALRLTREGSKLDVGMPNSGTADRNALMILGGAGAGYGLTD